MNVTKYKHACLDIEVDEHHLVIDPGVFSDDFLCPDHVDAVVITHEHSDHLDPQKLADIYAKNPQVIVLGPAPALHQLSNIPTQNVVPGDATAVGPFTLSFYGGTHAVIHKTIPSVPNLGVLVNDTLYYPGDSFAVPDTPIRVLAAPVAAPWLSVGEAADFILAVKPELVFPTHDAVASEIGNEIIDNNLVYLLKNTGITYRRISGRTEL